MVFLGVSWLFSWPSWLSWLFAAKAAIPTPICSASRGAARFSQQTPPRRQGQEMPTPTQAADIIQNWSWEGSEAFSPPTHLSLGHRHGLDRATETRTSTPAHRPTTLPGRQRCSLPRPSSRRASQSWAKPRARQHSDTACRRSTYVGRHGILAVRPNRPPLSPLAPWRPPRVAPASWQGSPWRSPTGTELSRLSHRLTLPGHQPPWR